MMSPMKLAVYLQDYYCKSSPPFTVSPIAIEAIKGRFSSLLLYWQKWNVVFESEEMNYVWNCWI